MGTPRHARPALRRGIGACLAVSAAAGLGMVALAGAAADSDQAAQAITITATRGATTVTGAEDLASGVTRVTLRNTGRQPAFLVVARLRPGVTQQQLRARLNRTESIPEDLITIPTSAFPDPGRSVTHTVALPPGEYVATQPPDGKGLGPATFFTVGAGNAGGAPPRATDTILMYDHGFRASEPIDGDGTLAVKNIGSNHHFIVGIRLNRPADARRVSRVFRGLEPEPEGPPPGRFVSIIGIVGPDSTNYLNPKLRPGTYVIACFYSDRHSAGREHSEFGMVRTITVT